MTKTQISLIALTVLVSVILTSQIPRSQKADQEAMPPTVNVEDVNTVSGYVIGGGDTSPDGLLDDPRVFEFEIRRDNGSIVKITYTAYPPSPIGDKQREKIRLDFHAGTILVGDYLKAHGSYDENTNVLVVAKEGDYIETFPIKP